MFIELLPRVFWNIKMKACQSFLSRPWGASKKCWAKTLRFQEPRTLTPPQAVGVRLYIDSKWFQVARKDGIFKGQITLSRQQKKRLKYVEILGDHCLRPWHLTCSKQSSRWRTSCTRRLELWSATKQYLHGPLAEKRVGPLVHSDALGCIRCRYGAEVAWTRSNPLKCLAKWAAETAAFSAPASPQ